MNDFHGMADLKEALILAHTGWNNALSLANKLESEKLEAELKCKAVQVERDVLFRQLLEREKKEREDKAVMEQNLKRIGDILNSLGVIMCGPTSTQLPSKPSIPQLEEILQCLILSQKSSVNDATPRPESSVSKSDAKQTHLPTPSPPVPQPVQTITPTDRDLEEVPESHATNNVSLIQERDIKKSNGAKKSSSSSSSSSKKSDKKTSTSSKASSRATTPRSSASASPNSTTQNKRR